MVSIAVKGGSVNICTDPLYDGDELVFPMVRQMVGGELFKVAQMMNMCWRGIVA
jgi:hypothetical protein